MRNCIVAQSGGPTSVINASFLGVLDENNKLNYYDNVYAGLNGIEGILAKKIVNLSEIPYHELEGFKYTPASGLGSCRYKMKNFNTNEEEYKKLMEIFKEYEIEAFFYIGGNDSMDTVKSLSSYAKEHNIAIKFIGIPKTIDNDLMYTDHTPGFGSAAKFIATTVLECYLDSSVYSNNGIFIIETMGRDAGWLTASSYLAKINGKPVADFIYLPEVAFSKEQFIKDVRNKFLEQNQVFIVASEGIRDAEGHFLGEQKSSAAHDKFGHAQLGGVCNTLKQLIIENSITSRVKTLELGVTQRCAMHCASNTDIEEAYMVGKKALEYSNTDCSGDMIAIKRNSSCPYSSETFLIEASKVANNIKYFPTEWINKEGNNVTDAVTEYISPLIQGTPEIPLENGLPKFSVIKK